jgi:uncharacterized delta-60 repeat protein
MFSATTYTIRLATPADDAALPSLAELDSQTSLTTGRVLVGELDGTPAAALSLLDGRVVANPFLPTAPLRAHLRIRAGALLAYERTPSLSARVRAGLSGAVPRPPRRRRREHRRSHEGAGARMIRAITALTLATLALSSGVALAAAGDLDPTFDGDGKRVLPFYGYPKEVLVQPDGKIVVVAWDPTGSDFVMWRLHPGGSLDDTFDGDGTAIADFGGQDRAGAAALQPDGKIVVAGSTNVSSFADMAVARFDTDGSLDETFAPGGGDGDGKEIITGSSQTSVAKVVIQPDGGIALAGSASSGDWNFSITRLKPGGSPDGTAFEPADFGGRDLVASAALAPDGGIVVAGSTDGPGDQDVAVARYRPGGSLDKTLAGTGKTTFGSEAWDEPTAVVVQPDGKIVVAGFAGDGDPRTVATRLDHSGTLDASFGAAGTATADFVGKDGAAAAALQPDGKILLAGWTSADYLVAAARLDSTGALDAGFGTGGKTTFGFGEPTAAVTAAALQPDGKLLVAGAIAQDMLPKIALARLQADPPPGADVVDDPVVGPVGGGPDGGEAGEPAPVRRCAGKRATIVGTARGETLRGTAGADVIVALAGNDRVLGRGARDVVCGGAGNDRLNGGRGRDALSGGAGRDSLIGGPAKDRCTGGRGRDRATSCETSRTL